MIARGPRTLRRFLVPLATGTLLIACEPARPPITAYIPPITQASKDVELQETLERMLWQVSVHPSGVWETATLAMVTAYAVESGTIRRKGLDEREVLYFALAALDRAEPESTKDRADIETAKAALQHALERADKPLSPPAPDPPRPPQPPPAGDWMLTLRNTCPRTVVLFFGRRIHGFGHFTSLSPGEKWQYSGLEGRSVWILDEHREGLEKLPLTGTLRRQIQTDCSHFAPD